MTACEYIEASGVPESMWPNFRQWMGWHESRGLVGVVKDKPEGDILGVAIARCLNDLQSPEHYVHSEDGDNVFVDLTVTSIDGNSSDLSRKALRCLLMILLERFGPRKRITFKRNGAHREYDYMKFMRKAMA